VNNIDSNVGVNYRVGKTNVVSLTLDVFNVFNFQGVTSVDQNYTFASVLPVEGGVKAGDLKPEMITKINDDTGEEEEFTADDINKNFKKPTAYQAPRQIRVGLKYTF
jgi:long-subunit fatty acid transport protein